tara:strand:- start:8893 stop:9906 length:1014 start_codon:yes stop_codon:yes gene_type:complete
MAAPLIIAIRIGTLIYKVAKSPAAQKLAKEAIKKGAKKIDSLLFTKPKGRLTEDIVKNMKDIGASSRAKGQSPTTPKSSRKSPPKDELAELMKAIGASSRAKGKSPTVKPPKSGGTKKDQGRTRKGSETKAPKSGGASKTMRSRRGSTSKSKAPEVTTTAPKLGGSSKVTSGRGSGFKVGPKTKTVIAGGLGAGAILYAAGKKDKSPTIIKDGGPSRSGGASKDMRSRRGSASIPKGKKRLQVKPKSAFETFTVTDGSPNKIDIGKTNFNVPRSIAAAKNRGSKYFYDKNGVKKLAVTAEDLKKSGKSLREWANTFAPKKQSKKDTTAFTRTIAAMG